MSTTDVIAASPYLSFFAFVVACGTVFRIWNRLMRQRNIRHHGWPPSHCDADGDFKEKEKT